jgi:hypothetical protein
MPVGATDDAVSHEGLRSLMDTVERAYERAAGSSGRVERRYRIGGQLIALEFAGEGLVPYLTPSLAHRAVADTGEPAIRVRLFDSNTTGERFPVGTEVLEALHEAGRPGAPAIDGIRTSYQRPDFGLSFLDVARSTALYWSPKAAMTPFWEVASPLTSILSWWMRDRGLEYTHGAAVGLANGRAGALIAGRSGSGKSTTALACLAAGMAFVADDYCLTSRGPSPLLYSIYCSSKVTAENLAARVPWASQRVATTSRPGDEKLVLFAAERFPGQVRESLPLSVIVLPRMAPEAGSPRMRPATPAETLAALSISTLLQLPGGGAQPMRHLAELARAVPSYVVELAGPIESVPTVIADLLGAVR